MGRLDRLYVNQGMVNLVQRTSISPSGFSDHHMIIMGCMLPFHCCNSAYWTFNVKSLQDVQFENAFRLVWKKLEKQKCSDPQREDDHLSLLSPELKRLDIGIAALSEVRRPDCGEIMAGDYTDYWSGGSDGYHAQGVAVAVSNKLTQMKLR